MMKQQKLNEMNGSLMQEFQEVSKEFERKI